MANITDEEKELELYKASIPAFFINEIEADKIILTLSVGSIGFYSALLTNSDFILTKTMFISLMISVISYGITVIMIVIIFAQNKKQLLSIISNNGKGEENPHLSFLDKNKYKPFMTAIVFSIIFMISLFFTKLNTKENNMNIEQPKITLDNLSVEGFAGLTNAVNQNTKGFSDIQSSNKQNPTAKPKNITDANKTSNVTIAIKNIVAPLIETNNTK